MLLLLISLSWFEPGLAQSRIVLTTNREMVMYDGEINQDFVVKEKNFDCSAFLYGYAQSREQYEGNLPVLVTLSGIQAPVSIGVSTVFGNIGPQLNQSSCNPSSCFISVQHNCPGQLDSENYFDIVQLLVQNIGTFSYYLSCDQEFNPFSFEWGQIIITCCATIIIILSTVFARLESFNGSGIEYGYKMVILVGCWVLGVGMLTLYEPKVAAPLMDAISWIFGTISTGLVTLEILFRLLHHTCLNNGFKVGPIPVRYLDIMSFFIGLSLVMTWWFTSKNWIVSDIISVCIIISFIKVFKYTSLKVAIFSYILILALYVIGAVLARVKHGQNTQIFFLFAVNNPFQFQMPVVTPTYRVNCAWIAFTSVAMPGLMVAYLHRFDQSRATKIYLISSVIAYFFGSIIWNIISSLVREPVPFDAVCPPFVLLTLSFMAFNRKQLRTIWDGTFYDQEFFHKRDIDNLGERLSIELPQMDLFRGSISNQMYLDKEGLQFFKDNIDLNTKALLIPDQASEEH